MNIAVVGAGFTGCMAALHAARRGAAVTLYETAPQIGGVLRDVDVEGQRYFNGCQYLREPALAELGLTEGLVKFPHEYGSLTALGQPPRLLDDCAQPALDGEADIQPGPIEGTALERLQAYGRHAPALIEWARGLATWPGWTTAAWCPCKSHGPISQTTHGCARKKPPAPRPTD